jgi:hypothetical protein
MFYVLRMAFQMAGDITQVIEKLKKDAIGRCTERIRQASKKRDADARKPEPRGRDHGITSGLKHQHGL